MNAAQEKNKRPLKNSVTSPAAERATKCVVMTANLPYLPYAEFVAWQLRRQLQSEVQIFIASADAVASDLKFDVATFLPIEVKNFVANLPQNGRLGQYAYWCLPAISKIAEQFDRILYLDTDVVISGNNVEKLFDINLLGAPIAAVRDVHQSVKPDRTVLEFKKLDLPNAPYFNSGVLLIDGPAFAQNGIMDEIENITKTSPDAIHAHDQSLLNIIFYNKWLELSPLWNWQYSIRNKVLTPYLNVEIMHLAGASKPWSDQSKTLPSSVRQLYALYSRDEVNKFVTDSHGVSLHTILKHLRYQNNYKSWLARFPDIFEGSLVN
jgi:lipopolysaccharide biosynthesis glycosyltransferase